MATWTCAVDGVEYSVGAARCPQDGATERYETGSPEHLAALEQAARPKKRTRVASEQGPELLNLPPGSVVANPAEGAK